MNCFAGVVTRVALTPAPLVQARTKRRRKRNKADKGHSKGGEDDCAQAADSLPGEWRCPATSHPVLRLRPAGVTPAVALPSSPRLPPRATERSSFWQ